MDTPDTMDAAATAAAPEAEVVTPTVDGYVAPEPTLDGAAEPTEPTAPASTRQLSLTLIPGEQFDAVKCALCQSKCPPRPASLEFTGPYGATSLVLCAKCEGGLGKLASLIGGDEVRLTMIVRASSPDGEATRQPSMLDVLARTIPDGTAAPDAEINSELAAEAANDPGACSSCRMPDPSGVHYDDCALLEPGDFLVPAAWRQEDGMPAQELDLSTLPQYSGLPEAGAGELVAIAPETAAPDDPDAPAPEETPGRRGRKAKGTVSDGDEDAR